MSDGRTTREHTPADVGAPAATMIADRYRQIRRLGTGGMSVVELCEDTVLKRTVAVKLIAEHLAGDRDFVARFRHEALAAARLQHPNIVQVFDSGLDAASGRQFIVMEYVNGTPLADLLAGGRQVDPKRAVAIGCDACEALQCAHRAGVVHRDVKPANLIVTPEGRAKLMDFGIAKAAEMTRVTQAGSVLGTVAYLSPEQAIGADTGPSSDIYSLAVVIYEMLAGRPPHEYKSITELAMKQRDEIPPPISSLNPLVPPALDNAVLVALSHDPARRHPSARDFGEALRAGLEGRSTSFVETAETRPTAVTRLLPGRAAAARGAKRDAPSAPTAATRVASLTKPPAALDAIRDDAAAASPARRRGARRFAALLALVLVSAAAAVGGFLLGESGTAPVVKDNLQDQIDGLRGFIQDNS